MATDSTPQIDGSEPLPQSAAPAATPQKTRISNGAIGWAIWTLRRVSKNKLLFWIDLFFQLRERGSETIETEKAFRAGQISGQQRADRHARQGGELVGDIVGGHAGFWLGLIVGGIGGGILGAMLFVVLGPLAIVTTLLGAVVGAFVAALAASLVFATLGRTLGRILALRSLAWSERLFSRRKPTA